MGSLLSSGSCGHADEPYKIPDYKTFQVRGVRQLEELQTALAAKCLKDPWIRNEAWRYHPAFGTRLSRGVTVIFRGFKVGVILTVISVILTKALDRGHDHDCDDKKH